MSDQLGLFKGDEGGPPPDPALARLADALPSHVRFGTSSWTFEGWKGLVYRRAYPSQKAFTRESLREYAKYPLFGCAGVDRSYYAPVSEEELRAYAEQLPEGFVLLSKVWSRVATRYFPKLERYGERAGKPNPDFLDATLFLEAQAASAVAGLGEHLGPFILEIPPDAGPFDRQAFERALDAFLADVGPDFRIAVELRDRRLLSPSYLEILARRGATHLFNFWSRMPTIGEQLDREGALVGPFAVARLMIPPGRKYEEMKEAYAPFDRIHEVRQDMRDDVTRLIREAGERGIETYVIANNKAEGFEPAHHPRDRRADHVARVTERRHSDALPAREGLEPLASGVGAFDGLDHGRLPARAEGVLVEGERDGIGGAVRVADVGRRKDQRQELAVAGEERVDFGAPVGAALGRDGAEEGVVPEELRRLPRIEGEEVAHVDARLLGWDAPLLAERLEALRGDWRDVDADHGALLRGEGEDVVAAPAARDHGQARREGVLADQTLEDGRRLAGVPAGSSFAPRVLPRHATDPGAGALARQRARWLRLATHRVSSRAMAENKATNVTWHGGHVGRKDREAILRQRGATLWFTGLSGAGKSTVARRVEELLVQKGRAVYVLDGDNVRHGLNADLGFGPEERKENIRRIGEVAKLFTDAGILTLAAFISPYRADRARVRGLLAGGDFVEVHVTAPLEVCEARDPKGLYVRARAGEIADFTGISAPYEAPEAPELRVDTHLASVDECAQAVVDWLEAQGYLRAPVA